MHCPHCGNKIRDEKTVYCPYCSKPVEAISPRETSLPTAAGILTIIAACIFVPNVALYMGAYFRESILYRIGWGAVVFLFVPGLFSILGFALGLTSGILSLIRKHLAWAKAGLSVAMLSGFITIAYMPLSRGHRISFLEVLMIGALTIGSSILSLIFLAKSKQEFS